MSDPLDFSTFDALGDKQWKQHIQMELGGKDYNDTLIWESPEGIAVKPFYSASSQKHQGYVIPNMPRNWQTIVAVFVDDPAVARHLVKTALEQGAKGLYIQANSPFDCAKVFREIDLSQTRIYLRTSFLDSVFSKKSEAFFKKAKATLHHNIDPLFHLAHTGVWHTNCAADHQILGDLINDFEPEAQILGVHMDLYQNAGATITQQLGYALAHLHEAIHCLQSNGKKTGQLRVTFMVSLGTNYFFEIAKMRALRLLVNRLGKTINLKISCHVLAMPSKRYSTIYDYNNNLLRHTTELMSGILGGANSLCNFPYDELYKKSHAFSQRLSRNQLLILERESFRELGQDMAQGAYYIESLTADLAEKALVLLKDIEASGGFLRQLKSGQIQKKIRESHAKANQDLHANVHTMLGINAFVDEGQRMQDQLELFPFDKKNPRKTLIEPILERRLATEIEQNRYNNETA